MSSNNRNKTCHLLYIYERDILRKHKHSFKKKKNKNHFFIINFAKIEKVAACTHERFV